MSVCCAQCLYAVHHTYMWTSSTLFLQGSRHSGDARCGRLPQCHCSRCAERHDLPRHRVPALQLAMPEWILLAPASPNALCISIQRLLLCLVLTVCIFPVALATFKITYIQVFCFTSESALNQSTRVSTSVLSFLTVHMKYTQIHVHTYCIHAYIRSSLNWGKYACIRYRPEWLGRLISIDSLH